jgi:hypothetical protein
MASANIELLRSLYGAWELGDFGSAEWAHPKIEYVVADGPSQGSWTGVAGMTEGFGEFLSTSQGFRVYAEEYLELDDERVLVFTTGGGRGRLSGVELAQDQRERTCSTFARAR